MINKNCHLLQFFAQNKISRKETKKWPFHKHNWNIEQIGVGTALVTNIFDMIGHRVNIYKFAAWCEKCGKEKCWVETEDGVKHYMSINVVKAKLKVKHFRELRKQHAAK